MKIPLIAWERLTWKLKIYQPPARNYTRWPLPRHTVIRFTKVNTKEKVLTVAGKKGQVRYRWNPIRPAADLSAELEEIIYESKKVPEEVSSTYNPISGGRFVLKEEGAIFLLRCNRRIEGWPKEHVSLFNKHLWGDCYCLRSFTNACHYLRSFTNINNTMLLTTLWGNIIIPILQIRKQRHSHVTRKEQRQFDPKQSGYRVHNYIP